MRGSLQSFKDENMKEMIETQLDDNWWAVLVGSAMGNLGAGSWVEIRCCICMH